MWCIVTLCELVIRCVLIDIEAVFGMLCRNAGLILLLYIVYKNVTARVLVS